jgi:hypothetical protein
MVMITPNLDSGGRNRGIFSSKPAWTYTERPCFKNKTKQYVIVQKQPTPCSFKPVGLEGPAQQNSKKFSPLKTLLCTH